MHKYLFAGGDSVNWIDPTGREDLIENEDLESDLAKKEKGLKEAEKGEEEGLCLADDLVALAAYWASLQARAPVQSWPFNTINKFDLEGELTGWTF